MKLFEQEPRQGFLLLVDVDKVIRAQLSFEIEGALRGAMEKHSGVAVAILASLEEIQLIGRWDRPFYMSFRAFHILPAF